MGIIVLLTIIIWAIWCSLAIESYGTGIGILLSILTGGAGLFFYLKQDEKKYKDQKNRLEHYLSLLSEEGFDRRFSALSLDRLYVFGINATDKKVSLAKMKTDIEETKSSESKSALTEYEIVIKASDILSVSLSEDGKNILQGSGSELSGTLTSAALGGLAFGGAGAVVGALAGQQKSVTSEISLVLQTRNIESPYIKFNFLGDKFVQKGSPEYASALEVANVCLARLGALQASTNKNNFVV